MLYYKHKLQSMLENASYIFYYGRFITADRTIRDNRPDRVILNKTIREAYLRDVTPPNSHNLHSTITERIHRYTDLTKELRRRRRLKTASVIRVVLSTPFIIHVVLSTPSLILVVLSTDSITP